MDSGQRIHRARAGDRVPAEVAAWAVRVALVGIPVPLARGAVIVSLPQRSPPARLGRFVARRSISPRTNPLVSPECTGGIGDGEQLGECLFQGGEHFFAQELFVTGFEVGDDVERVA